MKLKPQPPKPQRPTRASSTRATGRRARPRARPRGPFWWRGGQARRPGPSLYRRLRARLPRAGRILAGLAALAVAGGLAVLVAGPWLRVSEVAWAGERYTPALDLARLLEEERGWSVLAVDTGALSRRIEELPAVAEARVEAALPGALRATIVERSAVLIWHTPRLHLLAADDGTLFASLPADAALPAELAPLPVVTDVRFAAHLMREGDVVPAGLMATARRLGAVEPAALGSAAAGLSMRLEAQFGFVLVSDDPAWRIAFGYHGHDPAAEPDDLSARLEQQVAAVRTLFAGTAEAGIGWVDARNPGRVYFRAKG